MKNILLIIIAFIFSCVAVFAEAPSEAPAYTATERYIVFLEHPGDGDVPLTALADGHDGFVAKHTRAVAVGKKEEKYVVEYAGQLWLVGAYYVRSFAPEAGAKDYGPVSGAKGETLFTDYPAVARSPEGDYLTWVAEGTQAERLFSWAVNPAYATCRVNGQVMLLPDTFRKEQATPNDVALSAVLTGQRVVVVEAIQKLNLRLSGGFGYFLKGKVLDAEGVVMGYQGEYVLMRDPETGDFWIVDRNGLGTVATPATVATTVATPATVAATVPPLSEEINGERTTVGQYLYNESWLATRYVAPKEKFWVYGALRDAPNFVWVRLADGSEGMIWRPMCRYITP